MKKDAAGQIIGAQMITAADGSNFTGAVTCYFTIDNGAQTIGGVGLGICAHKGNGFHTYTPAQGETNGDHIGWTFIGTGAITATPQVYTNFPQSADVAPIATNILDQVTGTGNRVITIHVQDTVSAQIADVLVRIGTASAYTDTLGDAVFALDDGDYDVILRKDFVTFTVPEPLTVAGDGTHPYTGTLFAPSVPTEPNTCVVYGIVIDNGNNKVEGAEIFINTVQNDAFSNTQKIVKDQSTTSAADGTWELPVIYSSELDPLTTTYEVTIRYPSFCYPVEITVPDAASAEFSTIIN